MATKAQQSAVLSPAEFRARREELGLSRNVLSALTGLSGSRLWAVEQPGKPVTDEHKALIMKAFDDVAANGIPAEYQKPIVAKKSSGSATKQDLINLTITLAHLLDEAGHAKTLKEVRAIVDMAATAIKEAGAKIAIPQLETSTTDAPAAVEEVSA